MYVASYPKRSLSMRVRDDKTNLSTVLDQCNQDASSIGGYPVFAVMADGGVLCPKCVRENRELILPAYGKDGLTGL